MRLLVTSKSQKDLVPKLLKIDSTVLVDLENYDEIRGYRPNYYHTVYAFGGGLVADAAKAIAKNSNLVLVSMPTILSCDAFFTSASAYRSEKTVRYEVNKAPDETIFNDEVLSLAPIRYNASGWGDILSSLIACSAWRNYNVQLRTHFSPIIEREVREYIRVARAPVDTETRLQLFETLKRSCEIERTLGGPYHEESAEHFFLYNLENHWKERYLHGEGVALGILVMSHMISSRLFEEAVKLIKRVQMRVIMPPKEAVLKTLEEMRDFVLSKHHSYSFIDTVDFAIQESQGFPSLDFVYSVIDEINK